MIIKLDKETASTEGIKSYIFSYDEDGFIFWPHRREKVKFMGIKDDKDLDFLGTLALMVRSYWDVLEWNKKQ